MFEECEHNDFDDYFEICVDCDTKLEDMPQQVQDNYNKQFEEGE